MASARLAEPPSPVNMVPPSPPGAESQSLVTMAAAVATRRGVAVSGENGAAVVRRPLPVGYIHTVPAGYPPGRLRRLQLLLRRRVITAP